MKFFCRDIIAQRNSTPHKSVKFQKDWIALVRDSLKLENDLKERIAKEIHVACTNSLTHYQTTKFYTGPN